MKAFASILAVGIALSIAGCGSSREDSGIPTQNYMSGLEAMGKDTGEIEGRIAYPSEYNQRSTVFALDDLRFVTHPDGRFHINRISAGSHTLSVRINGFEPIKMEVKVGSDQLLNLGKMQLNMARGKILGRVVDGKGRSAVGLELKLTPDGGISVTDKDGIFQFIGVRKGAYTLKVTDSNYFAKNKHFTVKEDQKRNLGLIHVFRQSKIQNPSVGLRSE